MPFLFFTLQYEVDLTYEQEILGCKLVMSGQK